MNLQDQHYRKLFSSLHMVRALFHGILPEGLRPLLDLDSLAPLPTDYVSGKQRDRQGDLVWRVRRRDGCELYLLLMLEHQSRPDRFMSIRFMGYSALLYEDFSLRRPAPATQKLPLVLPILLYNGAARWREPTRVADLVDTAPRVLQPYQPDMKYLLLDEGALVMQGKLPGDNLAAILFRLEHSQELEQTQELVQTLLRLTAAPPYQELRHVLGSWMRHVLLPRALPQANSLPRSTDLQEISAMMNAHTQDWSYSWRQKGVQEGCSRLLAGQLKRKFGALPDAVQQRLQQASRAQLEAWSLNVLEARDLDAVFAPEAPQG